VVAGPADVAWPEDYAGRPVLLHGMKCILKISRPIRSAGISAANATVYSFCTVTWFDKLNLIGESNLSILIE
jgi:hypothetical protein